ncbi:MAG TPA: type II toxin-antitoxin system VapC family toxin [Bryobacteraceae bacterium]|nr:type II toxin-antitoxin system VapC family toxin [Bryobacteraceae bacterium]
MIFDSDVLVWFLRGEPAAIELVDWTAARVVSIVTLMELQRGAKSKLETKTTRELFQQRGFRILPLSESIGHIAAGLIEEHSLSCGLGVHDALIAATARDAGETLATANVRHFRPIANLDIKPFRPRPSR